MGPVAPLKWTRCPSRMAPIALSSSWNVKSFPGGLVTDTMCSLILAGADDRASSAARKTMKALSKASAVHDWNCVPGFAFCSKSALYAGNDEPDEAFAWVARSPGQLLVPRLWQSISVSDPKVFAGSHFPVRDSGSASLADVAQQA